jgi:hypothetical protein
MEDELLVGIFGSSSPLNGEVAPTLDVSSLDKAIELISLRPRNTMAGERLCRAIERSDFLKSVFGADFSLDVLVPTLASFTNPRGEVPDRRPDTRSSSSSSKPARREKIQSMVDEFKQELEDKGFSVSPYVRETLESLIASLESYTETAVRTAA